MSHANNPDILNRLKRAQGHLTTIVRMVEEGQDVPDIAQQLQAVVSALDKAKNNLIMHHIEEHLESVTGPLPKEAREQFNKLSALTKYL